MTRVMIPPGRRPYLLRYARHLYLSAGGQQSLDKRRLNQVLCEDCNLGKSNTDATDWRATCQ